MNIFTSILLKLPWDSMAEKTIIDKIQRDQNSAHSNFIKNLTMQKAKALLKFGKTFSIHDFLKAAYLMKKKERPLELQLSKSVTCFTGILQQFCQILTNINSGKSLLVTTLEASSSANCC